MPMVILGVGANLGNKRETFRKALHQILFGKIRLTRVLVSSLYESPALLPENAPENWDLPFLNFVITGETSLSPEALLRELKEIEKTLGRQKRDRWAPREIDLDLLAYNSVTQEDETLCLPHPEMINRSFTLEPLAEIAPHWVHPKEKKTIRELLELKKGKFGVLSSSQKSESILPSALVGVLNVTPDSFSDGGIHLNAQTATERAKEMINAGVQVLDLGAESTRPGAETLSVENEWSRLAPVLKSLQKENLRETLISIDSRKSEVIQRAISLGAHWINDVTGFDDPKMRAVAKSFSGKLVFMHHLGVPPTREKTLPLDSNPIEALGLWAEQKISLLTSEGFSKDQLIFDPGIGFGKTPEQSLRIIQEISAFKTLGVEIFVGHSRKSFLSLLTTQTFSERDAETLALSQYLMSQGVDYLRVHAPELHARTLKASLSVLS